MKASLTNHRQAPRKVRLVAQSLKGKRVSEVLSLLAFMPQKASLPLKKLIESALANARQTDTSVTADDLIVKSITVDKGMTFFRYMPRAFGRAAPIHKESSHVNLVLEKRAGAQAAEKPAPKAAVKKAAKAAPKKS